jgi:[ribosomal protein S18]-alanine N-acetyltransferase
MIANPSALSPLIREMRQSDVPRVAALERQAYDFPWSQGIFRDCLLAGYTSVVVEHRGEVIGYAMMSVAAAAAEAHLLNLCVASDRRREGYGSALLDLLMQRALQAGAERIYLEVRPSNKAALALYEREGFEQVGLRKHYYRAKSGSEDAVIFVRQLYRRQPRV